MRRFKTLMIGVLLLVPCWALAGEVEILTAHFSRQSNNAWNVNVTLRHDDSGWDHYADAWRVIDAQDGVLGTRTLFHPHVNEQPFTRSHSMNIPAAVVTVFIEAHDKVHGWSGQRLKIDLSQAQDGQLKVNR